MDVEMLEEDLDHDFETEEEDWDVDEVEDSTEMVEDDGVDWEDDVEKRRRKRRIFYRPNLKMQRTVRSNSARIRRLFSNDKRLFRNQRNLIRSNRANSRRDRMTSRRLSSLKKEVENSKQMFLLMALLGDDEKTLVDEGGNTFQVRDNKSSISKLLPVLMMSGGGKGGAFGGDPLMTILLLDSLKD